jgi:hypothetical protein
MRTIIISICCLLFATSLAKAQNDIEKEISRCAAEKGREKRLDCYDKIASKSAESPVAIATKPTAGKWRVRTVNLADGERISGPEIYSPRILTLEAENVIRAWPNNVFAPILVLGCKSNLRAHEEISVYTNTNFASDQAGTGKVNMYVQLDTESGSSVTMNKPAEYRGAIFPLDYNIFELIKNHDKLFVGFKPFNSAMVGTLFSLTGAKEAIRDFRSACGYKEKEEGPPAEGTKAEEDKKGVEEANARIRAEKDGGMFVIVADVALRQSPDRFETNGTVAAGDEVQLIGKQGEWYQVRSSTGFTGWMLSSHAKPKVPSK